jgi:bidirectional [NiFe] hydrogenase diaphorase subunit
MWKAKCPVFFFMASSIAPPSQDKRWKLVEATMRRHGYQPHCLVESLHSAQEAFGFLDKAALKYVAVRLRVPVSRAFGVATFYHFFQMKPPGEHTCVVCTGTACYIKGAEELLKEIEKVYGVKAGETRADGKFSVLTARCLGACGLAPAVVFDNQVGGKLDAAGTIATIAKWVKHDA